MTATAADYRGPFDPDWSLERLSRGALARLAREYMLVSMFHDRALMPHIALGAGQDATIRHADTEWMSSSPLYTRRNRANLGITGNGVPDAFKSFQFDIGAPHHFLDFHFEVVDHDLGYFWLPFCGAHDYLRQVSRNDPTLVTNMCHHMEDRTFDATLGVTNPALRAIPVHRPPKPDEFTGDHCRWEVRVLPGDAEPRPSEPALDVMGRTLAAGMDLVLGESREPGGIDDYSGEFVADLRLEDLSHAALIRQAKEFALDVHLLMRAAYLSVDLNFGEALLDDAAPQHLAAVAPPLVTRLRDALGIDGDGIAAVAKMLQVNPLLPPDYVDLQVRVDSPTQARVWVQDCPGLHDDLTRSPLTWLHHGDTPGFEHVCQAVQPQARVHAIGPDRVQEGPAVLAWEVVIDPDAVPVAPHWAVELVAGGGITTFGLAARPAPAVPVEVRARSGS